MDYHNNRVGRVLATQSFDSSSIVQRLEEAVIEGQTQCLRGAYWPTGALIYTNSRPCEYRREE